MGLTAYCNKKNGCCLGKIWGLHETAWTHLYILNKLLCKQVWTNNTEGTLLNKQAGNLSHRMDLGTCLNKKMVASTTKTKGATYFTERIFGICLHRLGNGFGNMLQQDKRRLPAKIWGLRQLTQKWAIDLRQVALQTSLDNDNMADRLFSKHLHDLSHGMGLGTCLNEKKWQHHQLKATKWAIYFTDIFLESVCIYLGMG